MHAFGLLPHYFTSSTTDFKAIECKITYLLHFNRSNPGFMSESILILKVSSDGQRFESRSSVSNGLLLLGLA